MPAAVQFLAVKGKFEMAFGVTFMRVAFGLPGAAIPDHHGAAAVFALRDGALERVVFDGVILDVDGEPLVVGIEARAARDGPALHDAVEFQPQVVVQPGRVMLLDDIAVRRRRAGSRPRGSEVTLNFRFLR